MLVLINNWNFPIFPGSGRGEFNHFTHTGNILPGSGFVAEDAGRYDEVSGLFLEPFSESSELALFTHTLGKIRQLSSHGGRVAQHPCQQYDAGRGRKVDWKWGSHIAATGRLKPRRTRSQTNWFRPRRTRRTRNQTNWFRREDTQVSPIQVTASSGA